MKKNPSYRKVVAPQNNNTLIVAAAAASGPLLQFRPYQREVFEDRSTGIQILLWGRQTGKSTTLATWAVDRLLTRPGRLVTVLSNSKNNGIEFNLRVAEVCRMMGHAFEQESPGPDQPFETMSCETRVRVQGQIGRIKILAANPRTARGFSGDLILDEFAFHEDAAAIWAAAEPILSSNRDFLCRIASTPNGKHNLFYRMCHNGNIPVIRVPRSRAYAEGCPIFDPITREPIDPPAARERALDKAAYDQDYECIFADENSTLLTHNLISAAERPDVGLICEGDWSQECLAFLNAPPPGSPERKSYPQWIRGASDQLAAHRYILMNICNGSADRMEWVMESGFEFAIDDVIADFPLPPRDPDRRLYAGVDVGRHRDRTVVTVVERSGNLHIVRAILRLDQMRLPDQQERLTKLLNIPALRALKIDATGLGVGLFEYTREKFPDRVYGLNFSSTVSLSQVAATQSSLFSPRNSTSVRVPEYLATQLLQVYEDRAIHHPIDNILRDDLRKPERLVSSSGRVSIAATRDSAGHADHFWSLAMAIDAAQTPVQEKVWNGPIMLRTRLRTTTL